MTGPVSFTDQRPRVDAQNKEEMLDAVIERIDKGKDINAAAIDKIVKDVGVEYPQAGVTFLKRLKELAKGNDNLRSISLDASDTFRHAAEAYRRIDRARPRTAGVYGLDLAKTLEQWSAANEVVKKGHRLGDIKLDGSLDVSQAEATIATLTPVMRNFAESYDAMLRGEKAVFDVMPKATMFALFPELKGKDLPALHEALADLVARADEGTLVGLFNHRWLRFDTSEEYRVQGPLKGDLNMFVAYLRRDAKDLRNGTVFGPSQGWGKPGTDPVNYLRSTQENPDEGYGLIPAFLHQLAVPAYERDAFLFGDESRKKIPTYGNNDAPPVTMRVEKSDDGAKIIIG